MSLGLGSLVAWAFWRFLHDIVVKTANNRKWNFEEGETDRIPLFPFLIGILERGFFTVTVAFVIPGVGGLIGSWLVVKMLTGWNRITKPQAQYRMLSFAGLMSSLVSILFGVLGGLIVGGQIWPQ